MRIAQVEIGEAEAGRRTGKLQAVDAEPVDRVLRTGGSGRGNQDCDGGATWDSSANWSPRDECLIFTNAGEMVDVTPMPEPRAHHAMVTVGEGLVLVTGGLNPTASEYIFGPEHRGTDTAWLYDASADSWTDVGTMSNARAWHVAAPLASGGAVIAGGYSQAGLIWQKSDGKALACAGLYTVEGGLTPIPGDEGCAAGDEVGALPAGRLLGFFRLAFGRRGRRIS